MGQVVAYIGTGIDEVDSVVVVFFDTGSDRKDVGVKDDVFRWEANLVNQNVVRPFADFFLALLGIGLAFFVKGHYYHSCAITLAQTGLHLEGLDAFLHGN